MALYTKPDFTFNDDNRAIIRLNRECVVELEATPDRNDINQYGVAVTIHNELTGNVYGYTMNIPKVAGNSVIWNQLITHGLFDDLDGWTAQRATLSASDNEATLSACTKVPVYLYRAVSFVKGHKYLAHAMAKTLNNKEVKVNFQTYNTDSSIKGADHVLTAEYDEIMDIIDIPADNELSTSRFVIRCSETDVDSVDFAKIKNVYLCDLTQMFGAGDEPESLDDARIYWVDSYAAIHPEYDEGSLVRMEV